MEGKSFSLFNQLEKAASWKDSGFSSRVLILVNVLFFFTKLFSANLGAMLFATFGCLTILNYLLKKYTGLDLSQFGDYISDELSETILLMSHRLFELIQVWVVYIISWKDFNLSLGATIFCFVTSCLLHYFTFSFALWLLANVYLCQLPARRFYVNFIGQRADPLVQKSYEFITEKTAPVLKMMNPKLLQRAKSYKAY